MAKKRDCLVILLVLVLLMMVSSVAGDTGRILHMLGWTPVNSEPAPSDSGEDFGDGGSNSGAGGVGEDFGDGGGTSGVGEDFSGSGDTSTTSADEGASFGLGNPSEGIDCPDGECVAPPQLTSGQSSQTCTEGMAISNFEGGCCYNGVKLNDYSVYLASTSDYGKVACIGTVVYACKKPDVSSWLQDVTSTDGIMFAESYRDTFKSPLTKDSLVCTDGVWTKMKEKTCLAISYGFSDVFLKCQNSNFDYKTCEAEGNLGQGLVGQDPCENNLDAAGNYQTTCYAGSQSLEDWVFCQNGCKDSACGAQVQPSCASECSASGAKQCSGNGYQVCGSYDSDSCLEWSTVTSCSSGEICSNGQCVAQTQSCSDTCSVNGSKQCSGSGYQICGNYDSDSCLEWSSVTACSSGYTCSNGACAAQTPAYTCVDSDGGKDYYTKGNLSYGSFYDDDNCLCIGSDCYINEGFCDSTKNYNGMPLWFDQSFKCPNGCNDGACVAQPSCTSDCSVVGAKQCSGNGYQVCGNYDSDSCLEWSTVTSCSSGYICSNGQCAAQTPTYTCVDSDNGNNYYTKGYCTLPGGSIEWDHCLTEFNMPNDVHEHICGSGNQCYETSFTCPKGCNDGACIA